MPTIDTKSVALAAGRSRAVTYIIKVKKHLCNGVIQSILCAHLIKILSLFLNDHPFYSMADSREII